MKIRSRHKQAIELLASGLRLEECAQVIGVSRRALYNWLEDREFSELLRRRESEVIERLNARYIMAGEKALDVLLRGLESRSEAIQIRSASIIRSGMAKAIEVHDLYNRIDKIEKSLERYMRK